MPLLVHGNPPRIRPPRRPCSPHDGITITTVGRRRHLDGERLLTTEEEIDLEVGIARDDGSRTTWLYIGSGPASSVEIQLDAADELVAAILSLSTHSR